jgi:hypothetical protein
MDAAKITIIPTRPVQSDAMMPRQRHEQYVCQASAYGGVAR